MRRITAHWTRLALADAPSARSSHRLSAIDGRGYLFGGEAEARQSLDSTVHCLDATAGTWTRPAAAYGGGAPAAAPQPRVGHAQAAVDGKLLVFGGRTGEEMGEAALDDFWQWCPASALWEPVRLGLRPPRRLGQRRLGLRRLGSRVPQASNRRPPWRTRRAYCRTCFLHRPADSG